MNSSSIPCEMAAHNNARLLRLPPELRNIIYRYTLQENDEINITTNLKTPPLLSTCTQIRSEAKLLWTELNTFYFPIIDCNMDNLFRLKDTIAGGEQNFYVHTQFHFHQSQPNWPNLERWCQRNCTKNIDCYQYPNPTSENSLTVVNAALAIASAAGTERASWPTCKQQLAALRKVAGSLDSRWLN